MLQNLSSDHLPILLSVPLSVFFCTNKCPPSFNFQKDRWDDFALYFDFHCSLSSAAALFTFLTLNAAKSSIFFGRIKRHPKAWWSAEVEAVSERRKAFAAAHRSDSDRQVYISASRQSSSVIAKDKAEAWQETCSSLSPKSTPKFFLSLLPQLFFSQGSASVFADHLRFNISASQAKARRSRARCYLFELLRATCPEQSHLSFCPTSPRQISCGCHKPFLVHCHLLKQSCHAKAPSSLWHGISSSPFRSFLVFAFLSFHLEDIYYSYP